MKRYLGILLSVMLIFTMIQPLYVEAADISDISAVEKIEVCSEVSADEIAFFQYLTPILRQDLLDGKFMYTIEVSGWNLRKINLDMFAYFFPYNSEEIRIVMMAESETTIQIAIYNALEDGETEALVSAVDKKINDLMSKISDDMSDATKALIVHDFIINENAYDYDNYLNDTIPTESYRCYGVLGNGTSVCNGYAYTFAYFMSKLGVECYITSSSEMNHAWNIVKIDGAYYHVDCTYDDPVYDMLGKVNHDNFLLSDVGISVTHSGWNRTDLVCDSTKYEDAYWVNAKSQVVLSDKYAYYMANALYEYNLETGTILRINTAPNGSSVSGGYYGVGYSGLFIYEEELYYNNSTQIMKVDLSGEKIEVVYEPDLSEGYIYGIRKAGDEIQYALQKNAKGPYKLCSTGPILTESQTNQFTDVKSSEYYYEPVLWAVKKGITSGLTTTTFGPEESCTRGQVVTFLWRTFGCPEPTKTIHDFTDIKENEYYYKAVLWAVEKGITSGLTATTFAPEQTVTRGQFVTFLHRAEGKPAYSVTNPFTDLKSGEYYYDAVLWALENEVTSGLKPTLFGPEEPCTRGQVVTFLYRNYK